MIRICETRIGFEREPLLAPFGFKGAHVTEVWQTAALVESENGLTGLGLGTQSPLWSDGGVFAAHGEEDANRLMYEITRHALREAEGMPFENPVDLLTQLLPAAHAYGKEIARSPDLRLTFALNALMPVDTAAWQLYCAERGIAGFDRMLPEHVRPALSHRHDALACIPLMTYGASVEDVVRAVDEGHFLLKIKIGADPDKDGDPDKMLAWDSARLSAIHDAVKHRETPYTESGRMLYYLDANGRYDGRDRLMRLLDHAEGIGALDRIVLLEEPFPEEDETDVSDVPVRLAADESAHSDMHAMERIDMGYTAIALKPIAKTVSMSLQIAYLAYEMGVPCFCADLTVNSVLLDWNKNVAARMAPLPCVKIGAFETNGHQNYRNWETMKSYHPRRGASWAKLAGGLFRLDDDFYACSGGILEMSEHYAALAS